MNRCEFSDLPENTCQHCKTGIEPRHIRRRGNYSRPQRARYPQNCAACGEPINVGDLIVWSDDDGAHMHQGHVE